VPACGDCPRGSGKANRTDCPLEAMLLKGAEPLQAIAQGAVAKPIATVREV